MPIYGYRCANCGHEKDVLQKLSDPILVVCPACSAEAFSRQVSAPSFQLKGSGWYVTDFRDGGKGKKGGDKAGADKADGANADKEAAKPAEASSKAADGKASDSKASDSKAADSKAADTKPAPAAAPAASSGKTTD